jgi:hypothetical protein
MLVKLPEDKSWGNLRKWVRETLKSNLSDEEQKYLRSYLGIDVTLMRRGGWRGGYSGVQLSTTTGTRGSRKCRRVLFKGDQLDFGKLVQKFKELVEVAEARELQLDRDAKNRKKAKDLYGDMKALLKEYGFGCYPVSIDMKGVLSISGFSKISEEKQRALLTFLRRESIV